MKHVIIDSSSAILMFKLNIFQYLYNCYHLFVCDSVFKELTLDEYEGHKFFKESVSKKEIGMIKLNNEIKIKYKDNQYLKFLGKGERDSIIVTLEKQNFFMIVDDKKACRAASKYGLNFVNALFMLKILLLRKTISQQFFEEKFERLSTIGYYSKYVKQFVLDVEISKCKSFI